MPETRTVTKIDANPLLASNRNEFRQLNVAAYCRVSTDMEDQLQSYDAQIAYYTEHICKNPKWHLAGIYADEGITGTNVTKRENFQRMIKDCEKGKIDLILTKSVSRFARNTVDSLKYVRKLRAMNIGVFFEEQNIDSLDNDSEMFIGLYSVIAQSESENISKNVRWGIRQRMKSGTFKFRYNLLGYKKGEDGEPEIVEEEAEIVRKIFQMYLDGNSINQIQEYLQSNNIPNNSGKTEWSKSTLRGMLENERYVGDMLMQKTFRTDCISKKVKKNNGELAKYLISNNHPAIIDRDTFKLVQMERARRMGKRKISDNATTELGKYSGKYALSELLICGECGSPYRRRTVNSHGKKLIYWRCLNRIEHGDKYCKKSIGIQEELLHQAICKGITEISPEKDKVLDAVRTALEFSVGGNKNIIEANNIKENIEQLKRELSDFIKRQQETDGDKSRYQQGIVEISNKIKALREQLAIANAKIEDEGNTESEIDRIMKSLQNEDFNFTEFDDTIARRIIECIRVMGDKTIAIIIKGGYEIKTKIE